MIDNAEQAGKRVVQSASNRANQGKQVTAGNVAYFVIVKLRNVPILRPNMIENVEQSPSTFTLKDHPRHSPPTFDPNHELNIKPMNSAKNTPNHTIIQPLTTSSKLFGPKLRRFKELGG